MGSPSRENHLAPGGFCVGSRGDWDVELELQLGLTNEARRPGTKRGMARWAADHAVDRIPRSLRMGSYRIRTGGAGHLVFRPRRVSKTRRKEAVTVTSCVPCSEPGRQRACSPGGLTSVFLLSINRIENPQARVSRQIGRPSRIETRPVILTPNGLLLRHISQLKRSGYSPRREVMR